MNIKQQSGFVLVLTLVFLAVMTLIGVSSMNSASMELKATANTQQHHIAFNAAQSVIEFALSVGSNLNYQDTTDQTVDVGLMPNALPGTHSLSASKVQAGCTIGVGSSLEAGRGFSYNFFVVTADGFNKTKAGNKGLATSRQVQGVRYPAAACNI